MQAESTFAVSIIVEARAAVGERSGKDLAHRPQQSAPSLEPQPIGRGARIDAGRVERLAGIDVANPSHESSIEENALDRRLPAAGAVAQDRGVETRFANGLGSDMAKKRRAGELRCLEHDTEAESPRIAQPELFRSTIGMRRQPEEDMVVRVERMGRGNNGDSPGHAEMDDQDLASFHLDEQVFGPPPEPGDPAPLDPVGEHSRLYRDAEVAVPYHRLDDLPPEELRAQRSANGFDFRQLRHAPILACAEWISRRSGTTSTDSTLRTRIPPVTANDKGRANAFREPSHETLTARARRPLVLHFFGVAQLGGSELGALELIRRQPDFQHQTLFLERPGPAMALYAEAGFPVASLALGRAGPLPAFQRLRSHLARIRPDLVHAYGLRPSLLVRILPRRPVLVQRIASVDAHRPGWQAFLDRWTARRVDRYIANSEAGARFLIDERGLAHPRIEVILNGIEVETFAAAATTRRRAVRSALQIDPATAVVLTVANLRPPKGLDTLVAGAAKLDAMRSAGDRLLWLIAGEGPLAESLQRDLEQHGLGNRFRLLGFRRDIPDLLAAADIFCLTSRREGMPVSILEAMAGGRPVVATDVGGVRELVVDGETGLIVPPGDPEALAHALAELLADPERRARLGAAGQTRARSRHTIERAAEATTRVYNQALAERKEPRINRSGR